MRDDDPLYPPIPAQHEMPELDRPVYEPEPKEDSKDPIRELARYVNNDWMQQLFAVRTCCYRCHRNSPIVHIPIGTLAFGDPRILQRMKRRGEIDVTRPAIEAFGEIGWKFQLRKSYCPECKGLGAV